MKLYHIPVRLFLTNSRKKTHNLGPYKGLSFIVPRVGKTGVRVRLYRPAEKSSEDAGSPIPVLFNVHGGAWIHGDAEGLDLQSQYLANHLNCFVVNVDYLRLDERPFPYPQMETADTVTYFLSHADEYGIDVNRAALMGYSAGGHIAAGAAILLRDRGVKLTAQVLCYPFLDFTGFDFAAYGGIRGVKGKLFNRFTRAIFFEKMKPETILLSPAHAQPEALKGLAPTVIVTCGKNDPLLPQGERYAQKLTEAGVRTVYREYGEAEHGFLEHNFPDDPAVFANESEQDTLMREAVEFVREKDIFTDSSDAQ